MENSPPVIGIVVPCFNEQEIINTSLEKLLQLLKQYHDTHLIAEGSFIGVVDDRSRDNSWEIIRQISTDNKQVKAIRLAANRGHQYALLAGLLEFNQYADCLISMDADLQDDIGAVPKMIKQFTQGNDIVFGVRNKRTTDSTL